MTTPPNETPATGVDRDKEEKEEDALWDDSHKTGEKQAQANKNADPPA